MGFIRTKHIEQLSFQSLMMMRLCYRESLAGFVILIFWKTLFVSSQNHPHQHNHNASHARHTQHGHHSNVQGMLDESTSAAQLSVDCEVLMKPIREKRGQCLNSSTHEVDICVYFASDYNFVVPFLIHHLSLGFSNIWIYNNDEKVTWFNHPSVLCMISEKMVDIQPWFGENALMKGLDHCFQRRIPENRKGMDMNNVWGAMFDIDEMLVLHDDTCIGKFVETRKAPAIALNWAFYTPEFPLSNFARTGNPVFMPQHQKTSDIILPHDMLVRRMHENPHIKTISRVGCSDHWEIEHCPNFKKGCPYGDNPIDPQGRFIKCGPWTPWVDNDYRVAQLNHYWTLSLNDFLRKIHRGKGGSTV